MALKIGIDLMSFNLTHSGREPQSHIRICWHLPLFTRFSNACV